MDPLVSIIIPTYNRAQHIGETLDSVIAQTYRNWECIVVDDRSWDHTPEMLSFYCERDSRIQFHSRPKNRPKGANSCRNYGFELSKGRYIQWLDSDDLLSPQKLEAQVYLLESNNGEIATVKWARFSCNKEELKLPELETYRDFKTGKSFFDALSRSTGYFPIHAFLISRKLTERSGPWMEYLSINQDGEYMARVISNSEHIRYSNEGWVLYRKTKGIKTSQYNEEKLEDLINSWNLIESYLKLRYKEDDIEFVRIAKQRIFYVCQNWPTVIEDNKDFFKGVNNKNLIQRVLGKAKFIYQGLIKSYK